ncbi:Glutamine-Leucine-Glutamine, QLQ [Artemisia annua]|uniref:Growth-regulating factor n=1 Tax=Artemisia annua TaxID=35608 RepID=A0A2U1M136_ARTAN|nr:Glutamine-Leucine-Glutamine, QLQ [Artemisia annua]
MSMRSDPMLSLSAPDTNNMLSFSSSDTTKDANQTSLFSFYQPTNAYIRNTDGWGTFQLGFSGGNSDPEPGRCRRTDGKKWRCSRDAVPDQKYCERHINRGRHRSRKPVESQIGHAVSGPTALKVGPVISSSTIPVSNTRASATVIANATAHNQFKTMDIPISRTQELQAFAINSSSDSLMYPANYNSLLDHSAPNSNPIPHFVDEWSKDQSLKSDWTQLSMSIPMAASDFSSSSNSPAQEKLAVPPLSLTTEFELDSTHKQASNWIPISWGNSMGGGGPLGEVLNQTSSSSGVKSKDASSGSEMWDAVNYHIGTSPTGVLQKTTFVSLSNSSSGGSPKGNKTGVHVGVCDELLLSTLAS